MSRSGNYSLFINSDKENTENADENAENSDEELITRVSKGKWVDIGERYFEEGKQKLTFPIKGISENLIDENLKIKDYWPDSIYRISFDYRTSERGVNFFIAEGEFGKKAETTLLPTGEEFKHFEMFFKSSSETTTAFVHFSIPEEQNLRVERIFQPKVILKNINQRPQPEAGSPLAEATSDQQPSKIIFTKINPTKYKVKVEGAREPYTLVFSESFDKGWKVYADKVQGDHGEIIASYFDGEIKEGSHKNIFLEKATFETWGKKPIAEDRHFLINGYANSWYITPEDSQGKEDYELIIEFLPQNFFYAGLFISGVTLIGSFFYLINAIIRNRKMAENWYPIINGKCNACIACVITCPKGILIEKKGQIELVDSSKCIDGCNICKLACKFNAISYYDGTTESILKGFGGSCTCHDH